MKSKCFILATFLISSIITDAQRLPKDELNKFFQEAYKKVNEQTEFAERKNVKTSQNDFTSGAFQNIEKYRNYSFSTNFNDSKSNDTLYVGISPNDSLTISGTYFHDGPIFIVGNGVLHFKNANATILGDIWLWGNKALLTADSSYLYFPQQYFYQRSLVLAGNSRVQYRNTTLDHSGLSHNVVLTDSAKIEMTNVTNIGFSTWGLYNKPNVYINKINEAGEFVTTGKANLIFKNAHTILLWHQIPKTGVINYSFAKGDTVMHYIFNNAQAGISGVQYSIVLIQVTM